MLIRLPLPQCFCPRGRKLRPWSEKNSDQNSDHPRLCIYWGNEKLRPWSEFLGRETQTIVSGVFGVGMDEGALRLVVLGNWFLPHKRLPDRNLFSRNYFCPVKRIFPISKHMVVCLPLSGIRDPYFSSSATSPTHTEINPAKKAVKMLTWPDFVSGELIPVKNLFAWLDD